MMKPVVSSQMNKGGVHMKKRLISFVLAVTIIVSTSLPAFATKKFDMSVFDGKDYVGVVTDDMTGWTFAFPRFGTIEEGGTYIVSDDDSRLSASSSLYLNDTYDFYYLDFNRTGSFASGFNSVIVKIGDNRYNFSNGQTDSTVSEGIVLESFSLPMKKELVPFMNDLAEHINDEIKVRFVGIYKDYDFALTYDMKLKILVMYDLYVAGNGTLNKNLRDITDLDRTIVSKNGEIIDGHRDEKILRTVLEGVVDSLDTLSAH